MPKGDKYVKLGEYLENKDEDEIKLSYKAIEKIIGDKLPNSSYSHAEAWWANCNKNPQAISWMEAGFMTEWVTETYQNEIIHFIRNETK